MATLSELYKKELVNAYGIIAKDNHCVFCGKFIESGYCDCRKASKINPYYKRVFAKLDSLAIWGSDSNDFIQRQLKIAATPQRFRGFEFDDFKITIKEQQQVLSAVKDYSDNAIKKFMTGENLLLIGNYGTGKTMLMSILCEDLIYKYQFNCRYFNAVELLYMVKNTFNKQADMTTEQILKQYRSPDFLFLDDIDKLNPTEYVKELMYGIVNYRIEKKKPTIISANSSIEDLDLKFFGEAVVSRLLEGSKTIVFDFKNMRIES